MKNTVIILGALCLLLALFAFKKGRDATQQAERDSATLATLSNKLTEAQTRMVLTQAMSADALTNLQGQLALRGAEFAAFSNRLDLLGKARRKVDEELERSRTDVQAKSVRIAELEELATQLPLHALKIAALDQLISSQKVALSSAQASQDKLGEELQKLRVQKIELTQKLLDPHYLRIRADKLDEEARYARKQARLNSKKPLDRRAQLELKSDGTVVPLPPTNQVALPPGKKATK